MSNKQINWATHKVRTSFILPKDSKHRATLEKVQALLDEAKIALVSDEDGHVCVSRASKQRTFPTISRSLFLI